jgi:2-desacetyl-2-hydroxyethyl bacteriochlorophyllide A dehydrogenase
VRAAIFAGPGRLAVEGRSTPQPGPTDVLIEVHACGVCGTDVHILDGQYPATPAIALGHEYAGRVVELGAEVTGLAVDDRVAVDPNIPCGGCPPCRRGDGHLCEALHALGVTRDGGFAELCRVPARQAYRLPDDLGFEAGALAEPLSCCLHGLDLAGIRPGDRIAILGAGPIGLLMTQLARGAGAATVLVTDPVPERRRLAEALGADQALDPDDAGQAAAPRGADVVLECVGAPATAGQALDLARRGGTVVWFGVSPPGAVVPVEPYTVYRKELTVRGAFVNPCTFERAIALLAQRRVRTEPLISHRFGLSAVSQAIAAVRRREGIKTLVLPHEERRTP